MENLRILYVTTSSKQQARDIGSVLVKNKLCACVNIIDGMESLYWWNGEVQSDNECVLLVKTTQEMVPKVTQSIKSHHSYDVSCVISLPLSVKEGNADYLNWLRDSVAG